MKMSIPLPNGMFLKNKKESVPSLSQLIFPAPVFVGKLFRYVTRRYKSIQMCVKYQTCSLDLRLKRLQPNRTSNYFHCLTRGAIALRRGDLIKFPYLSTFFSWSYSLARTKHRCTGNTIFCLCSPRRLKCAWKTKNATASNSIEQWTMGTFSVDVKDAGKGEREK